MIHVKQRGETVATIPEGGSYRLPNGDVVMPVVLNWTNGIISFELAPPPPPEPTPTPAEQLAAERESMVASPAQIRLTLFQLGLLETVQAIADSDPMAAIVWEYAAEIRRNNALIDALGGDGFTPEQIDDIFRYAMQLVI
jgi:hypothetical protein